MNKKLFVAAMLTAALLATGNANAQEQEHIVYHSCDFTDGIPADYATFDLDEQTLHFSMVQGGIKQGEAWARKKELGSQNYFAISACRYKEIEGVELKPSDDWMVTPPIWVRGNDATLAWDSQSLKSQQKVTAGYRVLISTTGNNPADFTQEPVFATDNEPLGEWSHHEIDLSQYEGETIYIAFHNNSAQGDFICIDNILVEGSYGNCNIENTTGDYVYDTEVFNVSLAVTSHSDEPITDITLFYRYNDEVFTETVTNVNINKYEVYNHTFATTIPIVNGETVQYSFGGVVNGVNYKEQACSATAFKFKPAQRVVIEEGTGMWCSFCPVGIVAMEILQEKYPEQFVGIAIHNQDYMADDYYFQKLGFSGLPSAYVNRKKALVTSTIMAEVEVDGVKKYVTTNGGMETHFLEELSTVTPTEVVLSNIVYENNQVKLDATVRAAIDQYDLQYRLEFAVVENNVYENGYYQKNGYSGGDVELYGWEDKPSTIKEFVFNHVGRAIYDNYQGIENSVPAQLIAGEEHTNSYTFDLPESILTPGNVKIVAMIIDTTDGSIVNADESDLVAGINSVIDNQHTACYAADEYIYIALSSAAPAHIALYNMAGTQVASHTSHSTGVQLPAPARGVYVVTITQDNNTSTHKVVVR